MKCAVSGCEAGDAVKMFCFPRPRDLCQKWVDFCRDDSLSAQMKKHYKQILTNHRICALHFNERNFTSSERKRLNRGSIPSIYSPTLEELTLPGWLPQCTTLKPKYLCCFPGCTSIYYSDTSSNKKMRNKHFFKFPNESKTEQLKQWKRVCLIDDDVPCSSFHVCEDHFLERDFVNYRRERLNDDVIPKNIQQAVYHHVQCASEHEKSDDIGVKELNEIGRLVPKVEPQDDPVEGFQDDIAMETDESLQDVPHCNTPRITTQSDQDPCHIIEELFTMYLHITLPYLEKINLNLQWVYKILSREEGCERIVYEYPNKDDKNGFVLIRDSKWDGINLDRLHLIAIAYIPGIMSLRDLGSKHISLLQNISSTGKDVIMKKYNVVGTRLRIFLQYPPSFYHLHVHFTAMNDDICAPHFGTAYPLYSVIQNIQMVPSYYQAARLSICLKESDELFKEFEAQGVVTRILPSC